MIDINVEHIQRTKGCDNKTAVEIGLKRLRRKLKDIRLFENLEKCSRYVKPSIARREKEKNKRRRQVSYNKLQLITQEEN